MKKVLGMLLTLTLLVSMLAACGSNSEPAGNSGGGDSTEKTTAKKADDSQEKVKMVLNLHNFQNDAAVINSLAEVQAMEEFANVDFVIMDKDEEYDTTLPIAVAGGEQMDVIALFNPIQQNKFAKAGIILPLDDLNASLGIDMEAEYAQYAENAKYEGTTVMYPHQVTKWVLYYNKKIFDDAGIAYPDPNVPMTWTEYAELAAALTSGEGSEKIYGTLHLDWPMFWYGEAIMKLGGGEKFYTEDGLSNIEDPIFAKALERSYNMQHVDKSTPTHADIIMSKTGPQAFMNGQYGMIMQGAWLLSWAADKETYPRDWDLGIAPMPVDEGTTQKTWGVVNGYAVAATSADPELAAKIAHKLSELSSKYTEGTPAGSQVHESTKLFVAMGEKLAPEGITLDVILNAWQNPTTQFVTVKVTGANNVEYETVIKEGVEKYFVQEQDLETTIKNIKERGDKQILKQ